MRLRLVGCSLALALTTSGAAAAGTPMHLLLATAHGRGSVTIGTDTQRLHGGVWLYRTGGVGTAHGRATISCRSKPTAAGVGGTDTWFQLKVAPNSRHELWRFGGDACTISVSLQGRGELRVVLRGY